MLRSSARQLLIMLIAQTGMLLCSSTSCIRQLNSSLWLLRGCFLQRNVQLPAAMLALGLLAACHHLHAVYNLCMSCIQLATLLLLG